MRGRGLERGEEGGRELGSCFVAAVDHRLLDVALVGGAKSGVHEPGLSPPPHSSGKVGELCGERIADLAQLDRQVVVDRRIAAGTPFDTRSMGGFVDDVGGLADRSPLWFDVNLGLLWTLPRRPGAEAGIVGPFAVVLPRRPARPLAASHALWEPWTMTVPAVRRDIEREYRTVLTDSRRWRSVVLRPGDVVVCTPPKCGTTWMQTIVANLVFPDGEFPSPVMELGPWIDARFFPLDDLLKRLGSQGHRRQIKTHTPADGIPWSPDATYLVVGRDGRDACMSAFNHAGAMRVDVLERLLLSAVDEDIELGGGPPPDDVHGFFAWWLAQPEMWFQHLASFWPHRDEANVAFFHYDDLLADLDGQMRRVADVLGIEIDPGRWSGQVERCTFAGMKAASSSIADFDSHFVGGADSFLYRGTNQRWRGVLTDDELAAFDAACTRWLTPDAASWAQRTRV